ncbi:MAG: hypothetical protein WBD36_00830, partial [Bacteroidota bacterium]
MYKTIRAFRPSLLHHNSAFDARAVLRDIPMVWLSRLLSVPVFLKLHGSDPGFLVSKAFPYESMKRILLESVSLVGVLSEAEAEE